MRTERRQLRCKAAGWLALACLLSCLRLLFPLHASAADSRRAEILSAYTGGNSVQEWADTALAARAGAGTEWEIIACAQIERPDCTAYLSALHTALENGAASGATAKQRCGLAMLAAGESPEECRTLLDASIGRQGIMSWVFGLHLLNNRVPCTASSAAEAVSQILSRQLSDGGWAVTGQYGDPDVTAMVLQALAPYRSDAAVGPAVSRAVQFLSGKQLPDGGFSSYGAENPESAAQVWIALCALGIPLNDPQFTKNGCTVSDGIALFALGGGQYAHASGGNANAAARQQVLLALTAEELRSSGKQLYLFHGAPPALPPAETQAPPQSTAVSSATVTAESSRSTVTASGTAEQTSQPGTASAVSAELTFSDASGESAAATDPASSASETHTETESAEFTEHSAPEIGEIRTTVPPPDASGSTKPYRYRLPLTVILWVLLLTASAVLMLRRKRSLKTHLTLAGFGLVLTAGIWLLKIATPEQYYQAESRSGGGNAVMAIRCDVICGLPGSERFPADGCIMPATEFAVSEGETALGLLYDAVKTYALQIEVDGVSGTVVETAYVRGIASLYEFDFGDLSGWTYTVNGERPPVGCGAYTLHDGDVVIWEYTVNL